jgi:shikimate kinase
VLVGLMGAGKSTVGRVCAQRLQREFVDVDELVEARREATVAEIFEQDGEASFRDQERKALVDASASTRPTVISCGGGVVLDPDNRATLRDAGCVVWLQADPAVLRERVGGGESRPLLSGGTATAAATLERLAEERAPLYEDVADARVETGGRTVDEVADAVLAVYAP